ncbi:MAG: DNA polymerase III subunit beta, partial [Nanopusillaceae archaeon]
MYNHDMKLEVNKSILQKSLSTVIKAVSSKPTLDVLRNLAIEAKDGVLKIYATDLEIAITTYIGADIEEKGKLTVNAKMFTEFVSFLPDENVKLYKDGNELVVSCGKVKSKFPIIDFDEFPIIPQLDANSILLYEFDVNQFSEGLSKTLFALDRTGISQPVFSGVFFEYDNERINLVSSDRFRLSKYSFVPNSISAKDNFNPIIHFSTLENVYRIMQDNDDVNNIQVYLTENRQLIFKIGKNEVSSGVIDGEFPNYKSLIPDQVINTYKINVDELRNAVKISNVFGRQEDTVRLNFYTEVGSNKIKISARVPDTGEYEMELEIEKLEDNENLDIYFKPKGIIEILDHINTENVIIDVVKHPRLGSELFIFKEEENENFQ